MFLQDMTNLKDRQEEVDSLQRRLWLTEQAEKKEQFSWERSWAGSWG